MRIYPFYHDPEKYPEFKKRMIPVTTRKVLEDTIQFMSLRDLPSDKEGHLLEIEEALDTYTKRFDLGKVFWMRANTVQAANLEEFLNAVKARDGYVFDLWGFVPGSYRKGVDWGEYKVTDEQHRLFTEILGDHFVGYDNGEQDGRYIGSYTRIQCPAIQDQQFQQRKFYEFFDEMGYELRHATTALCSLNYVHYFARENNCYMLGAETAQALPNANLWYAMIRGAGKQYGLLWFGNASVYNRFSWKSYDIESVKLDHEGYTYGPTSGTSLSLLRRLIYAEYLYNSDMLGYESGLLTTKGCMEKVNSGIMLEPNKTTSDKSLFTGEDAVLSPIGELQADCIRFVKERGKAGPMYTPVAFVINSGNGWCMPRHLYSGNVYRVWGQIPYQQADHQLHAMFTMLYPGYEDSGFFQNERGFLTPTPYGEIADVLMSDMRPEILRQYNAAVLAGWQKLDSEQIDKLESFADNGGTIIAFAEQIRDTAAERLFGIRSLGEADVFDDVQVTGSGRTFREGRMRFFSEAVIESDVKVLAVVRQAEDRSFITEKKHGRGRLILVLSPYGMNEVRNTSAVRNVENQSIPMLYDMLQSVKSLLSDIYREQQIAEIGNDNLEYIVNLKDENVITVTVINNSFSEEAYDIRLLHGRELSRKEIMIPDVDNRSPGYFPLYTWPHRLASCKGSGEKLAAGQMAMWEITYTADDVEKAEEIQMEDLCGNLYVSMRPKGTFIEELMSMPMLDRYFAGIKLDASYVSDMSMYQARQSGSWLRRRALDVIVDFECILNHYPDISLIRNMPWKQDEKFVWISDIMDKAAELGADKLIFANHRNAENHLTVEEAAEQMGEAMDHIREMAAERGLRVIITNAIPRAVKGTLSDAAEAEIYSVNPAHCMLSGERTTESELDGACGIQLSSPIFDEVGDVDDMIDAHMPLYQSDLGADVLSLCDTAKFKNYEFVCLDGVYRSFEEMYLERKWFINKIK